MSHLFLLGHVWMGSFPVQAHSSGEKACLKSWKLASYSEGSPELAEIGVVGLWEGGA